MPRTKTNAEPEAAGGLSAALREAEAGAGREQLEYLPIDLIDPDPDNFYSIEGINELADSIATVGLIDPIRVRPAEGGRYTVTSGHRRRAALLLLIDSGEERWRDAVPCIVDRHDALPALTELKLILANSATRQRSASEISREAERVEELLVELRQKGYSFPGRMQDHVAQAMNVTASKLKRLHAIRANLQPELLAMFDRGEMPEDVAFRFQQLPTDVQSAAAAQLAGGKKRVPTGAQLEAVQKKLDAILCIGVKCAAHAGMPPCGNGVNRAIASIFSGYAWHVCDAPCCRDCYRSKEGCRFACREAKDRAALLKAEAKEREDKQKAAEDRAQEALKARIRRRAKTLLPYIDAAGLADNTRLYDNYQSAKVSDVRKWAEGDFGDQHFYGDDALTPYFARDVHGMAKTLGCSLETVLGLPEKKPEPQPEPEPAPVSESNTEPAPRWHTGTPAETGEFVVWAYFADENPTFDLKYWTGNFWAAAPLSCETMDTVLAWAPIPAPKDAPGKDSEEAAVNE